MSDAVDYFLGENAFSRIEQSETIKSTVLTIAQKADAVNLEQLPEEIFALAQDIFNSLNKISGRDIRLVKEKLQKAVPRHGVSEMTNELVAEVFGGPPFPPPPKKIAIIFEIFDLYITSLRREDYVRRLDNDEYIDSDGDSEQNIKADEKLRYLLATWLEIDPHSVRYT